MTMQIWYDVRFPSSAAAIAADECTSTSRVVDVVADSLRNLRQTATATWVGEAADRFHSTEGAIMLEIEDLIGKLETQARQLEQAIDDAAAVQLWRERRRQEVLDQLQESVW